MDVYDILKELESFKNDLKDLNKKINSAKINEEIKKIDDLSSKSDFFERKDASKLLQKKSNLEQNLENYNELKKDVNDLIEFINLSLSELKKDSSDNSIIKDIENNFKKIKKRYDDFMVINLLSDEYDSNEAFLSVQSGSGGVEAMDFAEMLLRMYMRYCDKKGFTYTLIDKNDDGETGIKSATLRITGAYPYGLLKNEKGVHRLVRISPFDANKRRHTSFAAVEVIPNIEDIKGVEIKKEDLKIDKFRASGAGGQHVNKTDSAIRLTHLPTKIVVSVQNERSQTRNLNEAMKILTAKLLKLKEEMKKENINELKGVYNEISWGSQIRSYIMQPYKLVKDYRSNYETSNVDKVFDGYLDEIINSLLFIRKG